MRLFKRKFIKLLALSLISSIFPTSFLVASAKKVINPNLSKKEAVLEASKKMMLPILYTVLTTICAFLSLSPRVTYSLSI